MIIVSQDKETITQSLDLTIDCTYNECGEFPDFKKEIINSCIVDRKYNIILGKYKTEERAKEVLKDLISRYEAIELKKIDTPEKEGYTLADYTPVYKMPKE